MATMGGLFLKMTNQTNNAELDIISKFAGQCQDPSIPVTVDLSRSKSFLRVRNVLFFPDATCHHKLDSHMAEGKLRLSIAANNMQLCSPPFITHQSPISGFCDVFFQVWDLSMSINLHTLVSQKFIWSGATVEISEAKAHSRVPQCPRCWRWGHTTLAGGRCPYQNV